MKNEIHAILAAHLVPPCPHAELFNGPGRAWLAKQVLPDDERGAIERHLRELDRLGEDLNVLDRDIGVAVVDDPAVRRLLTIAGMNVTVAAGLVAAVGEIRGHGDDPRQKLTQPIRRLDRPERRGPLTGPVSSIALIHSDSA